MVSWRFDILNFTVQIYNILPVLIFSLLFFTDCYPCASGLYNSDNQCNIVSGECVQIKLHPDPPELLYDLWQKYDSFNIYWTVTQTKSHRLVLTVTLKTAGVPCHDSLVNIFKGSIPKTVLYAICQVNGLEKYIFGLDVILITMTAGARAYPWSLDVRIVPENGTARKNTELEPLYTRHKEDTYLFEYEEILSFEDASYKCKYNGMDLLSINSLEEHINIHHQIFKGRVEAETYLGMCFLTHIVFV